MSSTCPERLVVVGLYEHDLGQCMKDADHDGKHRMFGTGTNRSTGEPYGYWLTWDDEGYLWSLAE